MTRSALRPGTRRHGARRSGLAAATVALLAAGGVAAAPSAAHPDASWQFAPALAPPVPDGATTAPYGVALGAVTDISFWSPNRGLLITAGNDVVPKGLYAYDGRDWHQLSTVCGGSPNIGNTGQARIAWAGPDEFWTIADQRPGQLGANGDLNNVSLCHFKDGRVVGSYAMPIGQATSYGKMNSATCTSASDCWFGGPRDINGRIFHLHWNGSALSTVAADGVHGVAAMATIGGRSVETVTIDRNDAVDANEDTAHPVVLHDLRNDAGGVRITDSVLDDDACTGAICPPLPTWGTDATAKPVAPVTTVGLQLSSDGGTVDPSTIPAQPQLWAVTGPLSSVSYVPPGKGIGHPLALRSVGGVWRQVGIPTTSVPATATPAAIAAVPGQPSAWVSFDPSSGDGARVAKLNADGTAGAAVRLGPDQGVGPRGAAGPIACPAVDDCWAATSTGWLFHLTDGSLHPIDADPAFASVIDFRPSDGGTPSLPSDALPSDDSLANQAPPVVPTPPVTPSDPGTTTTVLSVLKSSSKAKVLHGTTLTIKIVLRGKARVQLRALRKTKVKVKGSKRTRTVLRVVAQTKRTTLAKGKHTLRLKLDRKRWPTKIDLRTSWVGKPQTTTVPNAPTTDDTGDNGASLGDTVTTRSATRR